MNFYALKVTESALQNYKVGRYIIDYDPPYLEVGTFPSLFSSVEDALNYIHDLEIQGLKFAVVKFTESFETNA